MLKDIFKKIVTLGIEKSSDKPTEQASNQKVKAADGKQPLSLNYDENLQGLRQEFDLCSDILFREFMINAELPIRAFIVYAASITDHEMISEHLLKTVMEIPSKLSPLEKLTKANAQQILKERLINLVEINTVSDIKEIVKKVLEGNTALVLDGSAKATVAGVSGGESRAIAESDNEPGVRGPKDGFVEALGTNMSLIRRRLKTSQLKSEVFQVGKLTSTKINVCYLKGIANDKIIQEVKNRIGKIDIDGVLDANYIEEFIMDESFSLFPLIQYTERPDKAVACLLEGRVLILVDNTPMPIIVPATFVNMLQAAEDYYHNVVMASFIRLLRFIALNLALLLPAVTVAAFSFHMELLPTALISSVAGSRQGLPLPISLEIMLIEFSFELLREAGVRLPKTVGQAVSTVGGLVIGQAAVNAGLVSPISVIVVATTAIASFTIPNYDVGAALRLLRFFLIILASILGGVGIIFGLMLTLIHLCSLRSFGIPYLSPFAPLTFRELIDSLVRAPLWAMSQRPKLYGSSNPHRQKLNQKPTKPKRRRRQP